jgi:DNA-binding MarR family transcriptional regulator
VLAEHQRQFARMQLETAFQAGLERVSQVVWQAVESEERWPERIRMGLTALLELLDEEPQWKHLLALEYPLEGAAAKQCTRSVHGALSEVLSEARGDVIVGAQLSPSTELLAELITIGVLSMIRSRILEHDGAPLVDLAPSLMATVLVPYLGRGAQVADLQGKPGLASKVPPRAEPTPIRPQPATMLMLRVIAGAPHSSNQEIRLALGIDRRQTSKLLKPLQQRGLIEDTCSALTAREPSTWLLTAYGRRVLEVISESFTAAQRRDEDDALPKRGAVRCAAERHPNTVRRRVAPPASRLSRNQPCIDADPTGTRADHERASVRGPVALLGGALASDERRGVSVEEGSGVDRS